MTYANSILNNTATICNIYDDSKLKLFTGRVSNVPSIVSSLSHHGCFIIAAESDISRLEDGDLLFAVGDNLTIGEIREYGDAPRTYIERKYSYTWNGSRFVVIDE